MYAEAVWFLIIINESEHCYTSPSSTLYSFQLQRQFKHLSLLTLETFIDAARVLR